VNYRNAEKYVCEYVYIEEKAKSMQRMLKKVITFNTQKLLS